MTGIATRSFRGRVPRVSTRLLDDNYAVVATNCKLTNGKLVPVNRPALVHTSLADAISTMYRLKFGEDENWLVWGADVSVARSPTSQDALGRLYYTGDGEPRMTTAAKAINGGGPYPDSWFVLGVVAPVTAPNVANTGGSGAQEFRGYLYTFVTALGEESAQSPAKLFYGYSNATSWDLSAMDAAPPNSGTISAAVKDTPSAGFTTVTLDSVFGLQALENVVFAGVSGMTDLNGAFELVSIDASTNQVVVPLATTQTYSGGSDTWTRVAPHNITGMKKRIYRTVGETNEDYKFVAEIDVATTTYADSIPASTVAKNGSNRTAGWLTPPRNAHSLIDLANGAHAVLAGNELCISVPYEPHAYPIKNRYSFPAKGIALIEADNNGIIILTDGKPYLCSATVPEAASLDPAGKVAPCLARLGVVDTGDGAIYPGHDGLYMISSAGARNLTENLYTQKEWEELNPSTFRAAFNSDGYYAVHSNGEGLPDSVWFIDIAEPDSSVDFDEEADVLYDNPVDKHLYVGIGNKIYLWDGDEANRKTMYWRTKDFELPAPKSFACAQVKAKYDDIVPINTEVLDANTALLADALNVDGAINTIGVNRVGVNASRLRRAPLQTEGFVQYTLIKAGVPVFSRGVTNDKPFRLPDKIHGDVYAEQVTGNVQIDGLYAAQAVKELGQV